MKRHDIDLVSLIFGIVFVAAAGWYFLARYLSIQISLPNGGWFIAGALIVLGLLGVAASLRQNRDDHSSIEDDTNT